MGTSGVLDRSIQSITACALDTGLLGRGRTVLRVASFPRSLRIRSPIAVHINASIPLQCHDICGAVSVGAIAPATDPGRGSGGAAGGATGRTARLLGVLVLLLRECVVLVILAHCLLELLLPLLVRHSVSVACVVKASLVVV